MHAAVVNTGERIQCMTSIPELPYIKCQHDCSLTTPIIVPIRTNLFWKVQVAPDNEVQ